MSAWGLGRVKTLGREEHLERRSSPATMSSQAVVSPVGNRGTGRTRFPSVNALSEFLHGQGSKAVERGRRNDTGTALPLLPHLRTCPGVADRCTLSPKKRLVHCSKSGACRRTIDGATAVNCGVLLNDFELTYLSAWRQMSGLLVKLSHDAEVHHGADDLDVCRLERAAKDRRSLATVALALSQVF